MFRFPGFDGLPRFKCRKFQKAQLRKTLSVFISMCLLCIIGKYEVLDIIELNLIYIYIF